MKNRTRWTLVAGAALTVLAACSTPTGGSGRGMGFFVTSAGPGKGADLGGLAGADRHCQTLAAAAGAGSRTWRAYLSTDASAGGAVVHARDRIGRGPWANAKGTVIASDLGQLHSANQLGKTASLDEKGAPINGRGDTPNLHDILTGSTTDGQLATGATNMTCGNWTSSGAGVAMVGHHDRMGLDETPPAKSWNSSHPTRGCSAEALKATGGGGLFYCFAAD